MTTPTAGMRAAANSEEPMTPKGLKQNCRWCDSEPTLRAELENGDVIQNWKCGTWLRISSDSSPERVQSTGCRCLALQAQLAERAEQLAEAMQRAENAEQRLVLAKGSLVRTGYFQEHEVSDDIAPRIGEYAMAIGEKLAATQAECEQLKAENQSLRLAIVGNIGPDEIDHTSSLEVLSQVCCDACEQHWEQGCEVIRQRNRIAELEAELAAARKQVSPSGEPMAWAWGIKFPNRDRAARIYEIAANAEAHAEHALVLYGTKPEVVPLYPRAVLSEGELREIHFARNHGSHLPLLAIIDKLTGGGE